jgi:dipeptidyl aminopeptidase/acylaminoacyl peptidase
MKNGTILSSRPLPSSRPNLNLFHVTYISQEMPVMGYLAMPGRIEKSLPCIIYCRGGIHRVGMVQIPWIEHLASEGFAVFAPSYRGNEGGEGRDDFGGEDRQDVYAAVDLMASLPFIDEKRMASIGFSRGGIGALLALAERTEIKASVSWGGVADLHQTYLERDDLRRMLKRVVGHPAKNAAAYLYRSPLHYADSFHGPVLIIHGKLDHQVGVIQAETLAQRLERLGKPFEYWLYPYYDHHFPDEAHFRCLSLAARWIGQAF